jgi:hypothetical protein
MGSIRHSNALFGGNAIIVRDTLCTGDEFTKAIFYGWVRAKACGLGELDEIQQVNWPMIADIINDRARVLAFI